MNGFYCFVSERRSIEDVFCDAEYHSYPGTKRAGMVFYDAEPVFRIRIHNPENAYFRKTHKPRIEFHATEAGEKWPGCKDEAYREQGSA